MPTVKQRALGKSGIKVSEISLGTEHLRRPPSRVKGVVSKALDEGINYIDMVFNLGEHLAAYSAAIKGRRSEVLLSHHLGSSERNRRYCKTRSVDEIRKKFGQFLEVMKTDYVDVANVHFIRNRDEFEEVTKKGGVLDLATSLKDQGLARLVGISTHEASLVKSAAESGRFYVIMYQVNLAGHAVPGRTEALAACVKNGVGVLAMKPFAGGKLLMGDCSVRICNWQTGGATVKKRVTPAITPLKCLSYTLSQPGVSTAVTGVSKIEELEECLRYFEASQTEKDFSKLIKDFGEPQKGECTYCDHCLPCPQGIEIGQLIKLVDRARVRITPSMKGSYMRHAGTSACTKCGECIDRCPFGVDIISNMEEAELLFG